MEDNKLMGQEAHISRFHQAQVDAEWSWWKSSAKDLDEGILRRSSTNDLGEGGISEGLKSVDSIININLYCNFHMCTFELRQYREKF